MHFRLFSAVPSIFFDPRLVHIRVVESMAHLGRQRVNDLDGLERDFADPVAGLQKADEAAICGSKMRLPPAAYSLRRFQPSDSACSLIESTKAIASGEMSSAADFRARPAPGRRGPSSSATGGL